KLSGEPCEVVCDSAHRVILIDGLSEGLSSAHSGVRAYWMTHHRTILLSQSWEILDIHRVAQIKFVGYDASNNEIMLILTHLNCQFGKQRLQSLHGEWCK